MRGRTPGGHEVLSRLRATGAGTRRAAASATTGFSTSANSRISTADGATRDHAHDGRAGDSAPSGKERDVQGGQIAIIAGISAVVLIAAVIGVAVFLVIGAISAPADVANNYLQALNDGELSTAWGYISADTQKEETRSGFISDKESFKGEIESYNTSGIQVSNGNAEIQMDIDFKDGEKDTWEISLIKEDGEWKIDSISDR